MAESISILGTGSWGTALAALLARNGHRTTLWGRDPVVLDSIAKHQINGRYLPNIKLPKTLQVTTDLSQAVSQSSIILLAVPAKAFRTTLKQLKPCLSHRTIPLVWAAKGLEPESAKFMHEVIDEEIGLETNSAIISGPTFAKEVAQNLATAVTVASTSMAFATTLADLLHSETFRAYTSNDVLGVEIGGIVKNPLAIAAGIADGLNLGANTRAALITRGLSEMQRFGTTLGAQSATLMGLAGLGDLVLTCTDNQSRNRRVGLALAQGKKLPQILSALGQVAEGVYAAKEIYTLAQQHHIDMPIIEQVYRVLYQNVDPKLAVQSLLNRAPKSEIEI